MKLGSLLMTLALAAGCEPVACSPTTNGAPMPGEAGTTITGQCTQWEPLLAELAPEGGWDVGKMSRYMWRESRCFPSVRSRTSDSGLLQVNDVNHRFLRTALNEPVDRYTLLDPGQNLRAAAALCVYWRNAGANCYTPWGG